MCVGVRACVCVSCEIVYLPSWPMLSYDTLYLEKWIKNNINVRCTPLHLPVTRCDLVTPLRLSILGLFRTNFQFSSVLNSPHHFDIAHTVYLADDLVHISQSRYTSWFFPSTFPSIMVFKFSGCPHFRCVRTFQVTILLSSLYDSRVASIRRFEQEAIFLRKI